MDCPTKNQTNFKKNSTLFTNACVGDRQHLFTFLCVENVPPNNNASERAIRNVKVKQKILGQLKTNKTAKNFSRTRSVIDTTIKNKINVLQALINY